MLERYSNCWMEKT